MNKVYVVHGYTADATQNWFPWLKQELESRGIETTVFDMPHPLAPKAAEWDAYLAAHIDHCDEQTFFVGHSLGCIALLRYFETLPSDARAGGAVLVSGFCEPVRALPELDEFIKPIDMDKIKAVVAGRAVVSARNDHIVPFRYSEALAAEMDAALAAPDTGGHFLDREGYREFPQLLALVLRMIQRN